MYALSPELSNKIKEAAAKKKMKKSAYIRLQLEQDVPFIHTNLEIIKSKMDNDLNNLGIKINYKARMYNTYGIIEKDEQLQELIKEVIYVLTIILQLLKEKPQNENSPENIKLLYESERKTINFTLAINESLHQKIKEQAISGHISMSKYIRQKMEYPTKYTMQDIRILKQKVHHQVYPIVSNVEQICFKYAESNIRNIYLEIEPINNLIFEITKIENEILNILEC
jgi:predicted HicB family RNase H-like nuclease